ncbi:MAG: hypothetical protein KDD41_01110 [Flavobacteriales bacterium]|nr:hypothetical protein [Flavobacteriales bacterium]
MIREKNKIELGHSTVELREDGIVEIHFKEKMVIGLDEAREITQCYDGLLEKRKYPLLHVAGNYVQATEEARAYGASEEGLRYSLAEAYVIRSLAQKIIANFYMKVNRPSVPTRFFGTKQDAEVWLKEFL